LSLSSGTTNVWLQFVYVFDSVGTDLDMFFNQGYLKQNNTVRWGGPMYI